MTSSAQMYMGVCCLRLDVFLMDCTPYTKAVAHHFCVQVEMHLYELSVSSGSRDNNNDVLGADAQLT